MDEDPKICRLCLKIIEKDVTYSPLTNNAILQNLNSISFVSIQNLQLTEDPIICNLCDNKLKPLANFKEIIVLNEFQIKCNQKNNDNLFLKAVSQDFNRICRLCLKVPEDSSKLEKNWEDNKNIFISCNIHLNLNIPEPSKICNLCDTKLQNMWNFYSDHSKNEALIDEETKKGNLSLETLLKVSLIKEQVSKKERIGEDNNNVLQKQGNLSVESSSAKDPDELSFTKESTGKVINDKEKITKKIMSREIKESELNIESDNVKEGKSDHDQKSDGGNANTSTELSPSDFEPLVFKRTPNTYARTKSKVPRNIPMRASTSKLTILSDINLKKQNEPSTSKLTDSISEIQDELGDTSIDTVPLINLADITLDMAIVMEEGKTEGENNNVTQELIALLEGTEELLMKNGEEIYSVSYNKQYKNTEELLRVLEDDADGNLEVNEQIQDQSRKCEKIEIHENIIKTAPVIKKASEIKSSTVQKSSEHSNDKTSPVLKKMHNVKNYKNKGPKNLVVKRNVPLKKKYTPKEKIANKISAKSDQTSPDQIESKRHNLRQKTIVTSFREMLNMKPHKKKLPESTENLTEHTNRLEKLPVKKIISDNKKTAEKLKKQAKGSLKKGPVKGECKNIIGLKEHVSPKPALLNNSEEENTFKELQNNGTVSQIQEVSFDKIKIKEISLVDDENPQTLEKIGIEKGPIKKVRRNKLGGQGKDVTNNLQAIDITIETKASKTVSEVQVVKGAVEQERGKRKTILEGQKEVIPKKRARKLIQKKLSNNSEKLSTNNLIVEEKLATTKKGQAKASKKTSINKETEATELTKTNGDILLQTSKKPDSNTNNSDDSETETQTSDKPVVVIIRRNKTKNKAQRDKTWQELTGISVEKKDVGKVDDDQPKRKRGRPPLPSSEKKPKKEKPIYYVCNCCPFKSISQNIILQHQFIHNVVDDVSQYKCNQCGFRAISDETLEQHKTSHLTLEIIYKCIFCEYSNKKKNSTMYHTLRHEDKDISNMFYCLIVNQMTEEEQYECFQCEYQNTEEAVMPDHVMDHQIEEIKNPILTKYSCKECLYKTKFEHMFKRHQDMHNAPKKKNKTVKKEIKTEEVSSVSSHQTQDESQDRDLPVYSCDKCRYLTYNKRSLTNHTGLKHTRNAPPDPKLEARRKKRKVPLPDEIYQCNECDYITQKKPHLTRHMIIHRSKENMEFLECTHCIFETKHRRSYKRHMEVKHRVIV